MEHANFKSKSKEQDKQHGTSDMCIGVFVPYVSDTDTPASLDIHASMLGV